MFRTLPFRLAALVAAAWTFAIPAPLHAQKALVYCPVGIDATGCNAIVAALTADATLFPGGVDAGYDGTSGTVDLAGADLSSYSLFLVPSLADGPDAQPYSLLRNSTIAGRVQAAFMGRVAVWSGTPDVGSTNRSSKDALIRNLAAWARSDAAGTHGPGLVALQDNSDDMSARYGWLGGISALAVATDTTFDVYSNVQVLTTAGQTILTNNGLQLGYTNMASYGLVSGPGGRNDATGDRSSRVVLVTAAGDPSDPSIATVTTDKDDYHPGDTVTVTGTSWEPGETVSLLFHEDVNPPIHPDKMLSATADALGHIFNRDYEIDSTDIGVRFILTATGETSGRTAQTTFTDNKVLTVALAGGGLGTVTGGAPTGISCPVDCTESVDNNADITLTATPTAPSTIGTWSVVGGASGISCATGSTTCTFNMNNKAIDVTLTFNASDLTVTKTHSGNFTVGTPASYAITVKNSGTSSTSGTVTMTDVQPAGLTFTGASGTGWSCSGTTTISCTRSDALAVGASYPAITLNVTPTAAGSVTNTASVSGGNEANTTNNSASDPTTVLAPVDLTIDKSHSGNFTLGVNGTYTLSVSNGGGTATTGTVTVTDVLQSGLGFVSAAGTGWTCSFATGTVTCTRTTAIAAGGSAPAITLTVSVAAAAVPSVTNTASVAGGGEPAANNGNNSDSDPTTVLAPDLTVDKSHTGNFIVGVNGSYSVTVSNPGGAASSGTVTVTDVLPASLGFVSGTGGGWSCGAVLQTVTCTRGNAINDGGSAPSFTITVSVSAAALPSVTNTASVSGGGEPAANNGNNSDSDLTTVVTNVDLTIDKSHSGSFTEGVNGTYTLSVSNGGGTATTGTVTVTDVLQSGLGFVSAAGTGWTCSFATGTVTCTRTTAIAAGGSAPAITLTVSVAAAAVPSVTNTASVAGGGEPAANNGNNSDSDPTTVIASNQPPVVDAGGPYTGDEGSAILLNTATATDPDAGDTPTYKWTYVANGAVDLGTSCAFSNDAIEQPTFTCNDDGAFTVTLMVDDGHGHVVSDDAGVTVNNVKPVADADGVSGAYSGDEGSAIQLNGSADDPGNNDDPSLTYKWTVNTAGIDAGGTCTFDDDTKKDAKVTCTDDSNGGTFTLSLVATDDDGASSLAGTATLSVANLKPVADAGGGDTGYTGDEGSPVQLHGSATDVGSNDKFTWGWEYTPGPDVDPAATCSISNIHAQEPTITCTDNGTVTLTLTVEDDNNGKDTDDATLTLANVAPTATGLDTNSPVDEGSDITLSLAGVTDPSSVDVGSLHYAFDCGSGYSATTYAAAGATNSATCPTNDNGTRAVKGKVFDKDGGSNEYTANVTINNVAPTATFNAPTEVNEGTAISLSLTAPHDPSTVDVAAGFRYAFDCGDGGGYGTALSYATSGTTSTKNCPTDDNGTRNVKAKIFDKDNGATEYTATVTVKNVAPTATFNAPASVDEGSAIALSLTNPFDPSSVDIAAGFTYAFDCGDGGGYSAFGATASRSCPTSDNGTRAVGGKIQDKDGGITEYTGSVTVNNVPPTILSMTKPDGSPLPASIIVGGTVTLKVIFADPGSADTHTATINCGSGATSLGTVLSGFQASCTFTTIGLKTITVRVTDDDGGYDEKIYSLTVKYTFIGFSAPVDRPNTMNVSKAGQAIPLKWQLLDASGQPVTNLTAVDIKISALTCGGNVPADLIEEYASGASGLRNLGGGYYQFNWKTPTNYAGLCKNIGLDFGSGYVELALANFNFKS